MKAASKPQNSESRNRPRAASFGDFVPDHSLGEVDRSAQFLDWAAQHMPGRFVPYTWIAKHAIIRPRLPSADSAEVTMIRKKLSSIKVSLWKNFGRRTVPAPRGQELGLRATIDDDDIAGTDYLANKNRAYNSLERLKETRSKMDPARMHNQDLKAMVLKDDPVIKKLTDSTLMDRLKALPPRRDDGSE